jgi:hypothetical protein
MQPSKASTGKIIDTYDPRNALSGAPAHMPFVLSKRQRELIWFLHGCLRKSFYPHQLSGIVTGYENVLSKKFP